MPGHEDPREALIRAAFRVQQAANGVARDRNRRLLALFDDIAAEIARVDPTGPQADRYRRMRMEKLLARSEELTGEAFTEWGKGVRSDMARMGRAEGLQTRADLVASLGFAGDVVKDFAPTQNMMKAILDTSVFGDLERGMETLQGWTGITEQATNRRIRQQLQLGLLNEESIDEMVRRVRGIRRGSGFTAGVAQMTTRDATTLVRTAATHVTAEARMLTFQENPRVVQSVQWVSALDSRTCIVCGGLDGKTWPIDDPGEQPPAHLNCRCSLIPTVDWESLGLEEPPPGERAARDAQGELEGEPRSQTRTEVSADTTYEEYLRNQPASVQNEILGPGRAKLFREEKMRLDEMVGRDTRRLTLDELERRVNG